MVVVANETCRLQTVYERILLRQTPVERRVDVLIPQTVKPDGTHTAIVGEQLCELVVHESIIRVPVLCLLRTSCAQACAAEGCILALPVDVRVIEMNVYALFVTLVSQLFHDVALEGCGVNDVIVGPL